MKSRWLAVGWLMTAGLAPLLAQSRMPTPVEDEAKPAAPETAPASAKAESPTSPYGRALVAYQAGSYEKAYELLKPVDPVGQDDNFVILESRILTELKREKEAAALLSPRAGSNASPLVWVAMGDVLLHKRDFSAAAKYYDAARGKTANPDLTLKLVYCDIGNADLIGAGKLASTLAPFDSKNPYDDHPCYYFARAALAQAAGQDQVAETEIQTARTNYGITVTNRYLKTYLQFFSAAAKNPSANLEPPPRAKP